MLLYDFGTKEALLAAVLAEARRRLAGMWRTAVAQERLSPVAALRTAWTWMTDPDQVPYLRLFFEVQVDAMRRPDAYPDGGAAMTRDWLGLVTAILEDAEPPPDPAAATLAVAALRGLMLDRLTTGDLDRTDRAAELAVRTLAGP